MTTEPNRSMSLFKLKNSKKEIDGEKLFTAVDIVLYFWSVTSVAMCTMCYRSHEVNIAQQTVKHRQKGQNCCWRSSNRRLWTSGTTLSGP